MEPVIEKEALRMIADRLTERYGTDKKLYDLTYDDLIRKLDEYFPRVKAKQMEIEI